MIEISVSLAQCSVSLSNKT